MKAALLLFCCMTVGCASANKNIAASMLVGALVGGVVGHDMIDDHADTETRNRNTVVGSVTAALIAGGLMAWHYRTLEEQAVEISGRYSRYRLCGGDDTPLDLRLGGEVTGERAEIHKLEERAVGKLAISLDDNTKWVYPVFRKRYLLPELGDTSVLSTRYIWEIVKPGSFVTRSLQPQYFVE